MSIIITFLYKIHFIIKKSIQKCLGIRTHGARAVVINDKNEILLVKHTYINGWHFPGGGVDKGESPRNAIIREIKEEAGIIVKEEPVIFDCYYHKIAGVDDIVCFYMIKKFECVSYNSPEILEAKWFSLNNLPEDASTPTKRRINEFFFEHKKSEYW